MWTNGYTEILEKQYLLSRCIFSESQVQPSTLTFSLCSPGLEVYFLEYGTLRVFYGQLLLFLYLEAILTPHALRQRRQQRHHLRIPQNLRQCISIHTIRHGNHFSFRCLCHLRVQILLSVKCILEQCRVFLSVLIQDVAVHIRDHVDLGMAGISLHGLDVPAVQLQLVSDAGLM